MFVERLLKAITVNLEDDKSLLIINFVLKLNLFSSV